jgi:FkbM family methyltransferase
MPLKTNNKMEKFIIDCGAHRGQDTQFYLSQGYNVLAIDASPSLCGDLSSNFSSHVENKRLEILNLAISSESGKIKFYESQETLWNSTKLQIANRHGYARNCVEIESQPLEKIILSKGLKPVYVKIDLEGNDYDAIMSLRNLKEDLLPTYISCETECLGEHETISEEEALKTLAALKEVGYTKFKLVDQSTLCPVTMTNYTTLSRPSSAYQFVPGSTGFFGESIFSDWLSYDEAEKLLKTFRSWFFSSPRLKYQFWSDWHATK